MRWRWKGKHDSDSERVASTDAAVGVRPRVPAMSDLPLAFANRMQVGVMSYHYKGVSTLKCPMDMALYLDLLWDMKPGAIIEFGSSKGGSALWLADMLQAMGLQRTRLLSLDINPVVDLVDPRIEFGYGDTNDISKTLTDAVMEELPRPLLVIDDASHQYQQVLNVLRFFHRHSRPGDYIVVEDGVISVMDAEEMFDYGGGPYQAIHAFLPNHPGIYEIDRRRCDYYGRNVTWNTDGYIRRVA